MNYPLLSEYKEAILWAEDNFEKMNMLRPVKDERGEPIMSSGNFAVVFKMEDIQTKKLYAVKCFLKEQAGRAESYQKIARELEFVNSSFLTSIKYLEKELYVSSQATSETEFPILLMDWVEGVTLDNYLREHLHESYTLEMLSFQFSRLATWLLAQPFAHGDLKPDNILVRRDGTLVLVDYDGMYVPTMQGEKSRELGSPDFRHPLRTENDFNEHIDDFALATIALSLKAIASKPELLQEYGASDRLLFAASDYNDLPHCKTLSALQSLTASTELSTLLGLFLIAWSNKNLAQVSFRLFSQAKPEKKEEEALSTEATKEELAEAWEDEYGVKYSKDGKKLLKAPRNLTTYTIRQGIKVICDEAFRGRSLRTINIPNSVTHIGNQAFSWCTLQSINIPNSVIHIGDQAFSFCASQQSINIPNSVTHIGNNPFMDCKNLIIKCQSDKFEVIEDALYDKEKKTLIGYYGKEETFNIPDSVTTIGDGAFYICESLQSIYIPNSVTHIGNHAFGACLLLQSINIQNSITTIGDQAFSSCYSLQNISIPNSVTHIGNNPFIDCKNLIITCQADKFEIVEDALYEKENKTLIGYYGKKETFYIPNSITSIGDWAFYNCESLQSIYIPNSVIHIGNYAFSFCKSLQNINITNSVTTIGDQGFSECSSLQSINIPDSVTTIGDWAFSSCASLQHIKIPNSVTYIENYAFSFCNSLQNIKIPNSVTFIGEGAFYDCKSLQSINIPYGSYEHFAKLLPDYEDKLREIDF